MTQAGHRTDASAPRWLELPGHRVEIAEISESRAGRPALLFMHEGLGSVSHWRDFPARVAAATGCRSIVYSRSGFGRSSPRQQPFTPRFMHEEAFDVLPRIRERLGLERPVLVGHSTGASMSLIYAGAGRWAAAGVVAMAPIAFIEDSNLDSIRKTRSLYRTSRLRDSLARHHDDVDAVFFGWADTWLDPEFRRWTLEAELGGIGCPILAIRGELDQYVSAAQVDAIRLRATRSLWVETLSLPGCGHAPHRDQPRAVIEAMCAFVDRLDNPP